MSRDDEVVGVESSNDGTSDEESENNKAQELLILNVMATIQQQLQQQRKDLVTEIKTMRTSMRTSMYTINKKLQN